VVGEYIVSGQFLIQRTNKTRIWVPFQNLKSCKLLLGDWTGLLLRAPDERPSNRGFAISDNPEHGDCYFPAGDSVHRDYIQYGIIWR
jgi:hypothetical protein